MDGEKPQGHGDFANLIRAQWPPAELRALHEHVAALEEHPGYQAVAKLLKVREAKLVDRLVIGEPGEVRVTDQVLGMAAGLRQAARAAESILYEAREARERAEQAAADADAESEPK